MDKYSSDDDSFTLQGDAGADRLRATQGVPTFVPPFIQSQRLAPVDVSNNILGRWNHHVDDTSDFSLQVYYDYLNVENGFKYNQNTFDADFHDRFALGSSNEISWGLGYRFVNGEVASSDVIAFAPTKNDNLYSTFVQDTITLEPKQWFLTLGSKFEHNDYTGFEVEPSGRLMWTPDNHNTIWGAISRAVRTPSRLENDVNIIESRFQEPVGGGATVPAQVNLLGNSSEQSEKLVAYELGYRLKPIKQVSIDVATFYNNYDKLSSAETGTPEAGVPVTIPVQYANNVHGDTWGGEISSTLEVTSQWRLAGSYSLLEAAFEAERGSTDTSSAAQDEGSAPQNQFQLHSGLDITKNVQLNTALYYVGRVPEFNIPSYFSTDLNVSWQIKEGVVLQAGVLNLLQSHHPEYGAFVDTTVASETPRTVYAELSYKF